MDTTFLMLEICMGIGNPHGSWVWVFMDMGMGCEMMTHVPRTPDPCTHTSMNADINNQ